MSTQLKPFLSEIADKLRPYKENLYKFENLLTRFWPSNTEAEELLNNGIKIIGLGYDTPVVINVGPIKNFIGKTLTASCEDATIQFMLWDLGWGYNEYLGDSGTSCTATIRESEYGYAHDVGLIIYPNGYSDSVTVRNIVIEDTSNLVNAQDFAKRIDTVYECGKKDQYKEFWDNYISSSSLSFSGRGWNDTTFNPPSGEITVSLGNEFFQYCAVTDLKKILERNGTTIDFSSCASFDYFAHNSWITKFPELDMSKAIRYNYSFYFCQNLKSIDKIILSSTNPRPFKGTFEQCPALEEILFDGYIRSNISFSSSPLLSYTSLTHEFIDWAENYPDGNGIIPSLYDFRGNGDTTTTCQLTLHADSIAKLSSRDLANITQKGWSLVNNSGEAIA